MKTDKVHRMHLKVVTYFVFILSITILSIFSSMDNQVSAQGGAPHVNLTPVGTVEATPEAGPFQSSTNDLQVASASIVTRIPVGTSPNGITLNSNTRKAYVINSTSSNVSVLDISANQHIHDIWAGQKLYWGIALKPGTEHLYVADNVSGAVLDIDEGSSSIIDTIHLGNVLPEGIAINASLNKAYVAHSGNLLSVIDLSTNKVIKNVDTGYYNHMIAVNEVTNRVYVTRSFYNRVTVIDGNTDTYLQSVFVGSSPWGVAVNTRSNLIYVANSGSNTVSVINGATNTVIKTIPVQNRPWGIAINEEANRIYVANSWSNSVSIIDGNTDQVVETVPNVGNRPVGISTNPKSGRVYVTNEAGNNVSVILDGAAVPTPSTLTPIILVPGYYASYNAHRMSPPNNYPDEWEWWPVLLGWPPPFEPTEFTNCPYDAARCTYQPLIDALASVGYDSDPHSPNQNLFIAYYNWLRPNAESATNDLAPVISQALSKTGATKVHIITHSNGGLVTRNWIQNQAASTVVDELIMLAPPNYGVARVYPAWAGGDTTREGWDINWFVFHPLLLEYGFPPICNESCRHNFIHSYVPSAKDLIPVHDFWMSQEGQFQSYRDMYNDNRNLTLDAMNQDVQNGLINKVGHITIIGGLTYPTHDAYVYQNCPNCSPLWLDGRVVQDIRDDGDGTVQRFRVGLPGITPIMITSEHAEIVVKAIPLIFEIFQLPSLSQTSISTSDSTSTSPPEDTLVFTVVRHVNTDGAEPDETSYSVPVHLLITDPLGRKLGYQTDGTFINQIPYARYHGDADKPKIIAIPNPIEGTYRTQVIGSNSGTYGIVVATQKSDKILNVINGTTSTGQITTYNIDYVLPTADIYLPIIIKN